MNYLEKHRNEIFKKYSTEELLKDIENYKNGSGRLSKVLNQFFEECIFNCKAPRGTKKIDFSGMPKGFKTPKLSNCKRISARKTWIVDECTVA